MARGTASRTRDARDDTATLPSADAERRALQEETAPLFAQRVHGGLCILLVALALFMPHVTRNDPAETTPLYGAKLVQLGTILLAFVALRSSVTWTRCLAVSLVVACEVYLTTAISGIFADDLIGTITLSIVLSMGTAMLLPWGARPQLQSVTVGAFAILLNIAFSSRSVESCTSPVIAVALAFLSSVYAAHQTEQYRLTRRRLEESIGELRIAEQAGDSLASPLVLERICRLTAELAPCDRAAIYLWSDRYKAFIPAADHGTPAHLSERLADRRHQPESIQADLRAGKMLVWSRDRPPSPEATRLLAEAELSALAVIPLPSRGRPVGCLMLGLHTEPEFSESTLGVARGVARQAASLIENARLFTKVQKAAAFRASLAELAAATNAQGDPKEVGRLLCVRGAALFTVSSGAAFVRDGEMLTALATTGTSADAEGLRLSLTDEPGPITQAFDRGRPLFVNDVTTTPLAGHWLVTTFGFQSILVIPLIGQSGPVGCLVYGDRERRHPFSPAIADEAVFLAGIAGAAFERAHYGEVEEARRYAEQHAAGLARHAGELAKARNAALEAARTKAEFLANMSHEIRTPMTAILGYVRLLANPALSERDHAEHLATIRRNGEHLLSLINDILDLSKIDAGRMTLERVACAPLELIADVASLMRVRAIEKGLALEVAYRGAVPARIEADPTRLRQILINLIGNAIKFTDVGSVRIEVEAVARPGAPSLLRVDVVDTGCGLTEEAQGLLFQSFAQVDASTTRASGGTGLGLAISKRLAQMLGGDIGVRSAPGMGSTFTLTVQTGPLDGVPMLAHPSEIVLPRATAPPRMDRLSAPARVLLVEDALDNQRLLAFYLREAGAEVSVAGDGVGACDAAMAATDAGRPFDVILMDVQMPKLDGYHATERLRGMRYGGVIIALTAHAMEGERAKCLAAGCDDFLTKPVDPPELIAAIERHLGTRPANDAAERETPLVSHLADQQGLEELLDEFVRDLPQRVLAIEQSLESGDVERLGVQVHQLKGTAGGYGFPPITQAAHDLEVALKAQLPQGELVARLGRLRVLCARAAARTPAPIDRAGDGVAAGMHSGRLPHAMQSPSAPAG